MNIFIICSKHFYNKIPQIADELKNYGHNLTFPNSYEEPFKEEDMKKKGLEEHIEFKQRMMRLHEPKIKENDAVLALNLEKNGKSNYIGGGTFMEIVKAGELDKKIFLYNPIPECIFTDELTGINPTVINQDLSRII
jgi:hypothetical protein